MAWRPFGGHDFRLSFCWAVLQAWAYFSLSLVASPDIPRTVQCARDRYNTNIVITDAGDRYNTNIVITDDGDTRSPGPPPIGINIIMFCF